jgi:hypothetical protein
MLQILMKVIGLLTEIQKKISILIVKEYLIGIYNFSQTIIKQLFMFFLHTAYKYSNL